MVNNTKTPLQVMHTRLRSQHTALRIQKDFIRAMVDTQHIVDELADTLPQVCVRVCLWWRAQWAFHSVGGGSDEETPYPSVLVAWSPRALLSLWENLPVPTRAF